MKGTLGGKEFYSECLTLELITFVYKTAQITRQNSAEQSLKWEVQRRSALYNISLRRHFCLCEGAIGVEDGRVSGSAFIWNRWCKDYSWYDNM